MPSLAGKQVQNSDEPCRRLPRFAGGREAAAAGGSRGSGSDGIGGGRCAGNERPGSRSGKREDEGKGFRRAAPGIRCSRRSPWERWGHAMRFHT